MTRAEFLNELSVRLSGLSQDEINKSTSYFSEIISDKTEDGMTEEEAVASLGNLDDIVNKILMDAPMTQVLKTRMNKKLPTWALVLLIIGSPIWLSLLIAVISVIFAIYASVWAAAVSLWAVVGGLILGGIGGTVGSFFLFGSNGAAALLSLGAGLFCAGIGLLLIFAAIEVTRGCCMATVFVAKKIKGIIVGRRASI